MNLRDFISLSLSIHEKQRFSFFDIYLVDIYSKTEKDNRCGLSFKIFIFLTLILQIKEVLLILKSIYHLNHFESGLECTTKVSVEFSI